MALKSKIRKIGNSQGVILPAEILEELHMKSGSDIEVSVVDGVILISPPAPTLSQLLATVPKGAKFKEAKSGKARGKED